MAKEEIISGKRKTSVAKARIKDGEGKIVINKIPYQKLNEFHKLLIEEPVMIAKKVLKKFSYDIEVKVSGGGRESQIEAARLAIAKAIISKTKSKELREMMASYDKYMVVADTRRKEAYKPGDSKARAKRQSSKR
ncbi:30S ribosomal protein S9 [Candidatus Pacearchaeota archaeon]|nr:30S ribosomal protein S9 [Candidatus Pacearchaeota archaeon]|tara:strand:+ start:763 stop:1167 length:405 start_codon:yes stop_codon:yes gene_type:complete